MEIHAHLRNHFESDFRRNPCEYNLVRDINCIQSMMLRGSVDYTHQRLKILRLNLEIHKFLVNLSLEAKNREALSIISRFRHFISIENRTISGFDFSVQMEFKNS